MEQTPGCIFLFPPSSTREKHVLFSPAFLISLPKWYNISAPHPIMSTRLHDWNKLLCTLSFTLFALRERVCALVSQDWRMGVLVKCNQLEVVLAPSFHKAHNIAPYSNRVILTPPRSKQKQPLRYGDPLRHQGVAWVGCHRRGWNHPFPFAWTTHVNSTATREQ